MISAETPATAPSAGRYRLRTRLGHGAVGEVWSAEDPQIGRSVAVKLLKIPDGLSEGRRAQWESRFLLEARAAGRLSHPGIVSIHDVGTAGDGRPFIVMELVDGETLDAARSRTIPPPFAQVVNWTIQIAEALDAAHAKGVVHRDVKPANLLVGSDGRARIADFGIARLAESELTREGTFMGSPAFAAPEQIRGDKVDGRADLFSLGAVFYLLATGKRPFDGENLPAIAYAVCHAEPERPSSINPKIDPAFEAVILRALAKDPAARFASGAEFAQALRAANDPEPVDRTLVEAAPVDRVEDKAATLASAAAVGAVRFSRRVATDAKRHAREVANWTREKAPGVRDRIAVLVTNLRGVNPRILAGIVGTIVLVVLFARLEISPANSGRGEGLGEKLRAIAAGRSAAVHVVVDHDLERGVLEISSDGESLLKRSLQAPERKFLGVWGYRSGDESARLRLRSGAHELTVSVSGPNGLSLSKTLDVEVDPKEGYRLGIDVATWPIDRIATDWDVVEE
ncbi:MAG TPA: serine/threonine-protein kinase [Candidatus Polarisedimenticolaceae bacterium]